jgi:hypothetical protein
MATETKQRAKRAAKKVRQSNRRFERATAAEKRVMIAKDAIKQIEARKFIPRSGTYFRCHRHLQSGEPLQGQLTGPEAPACTVCGIGAAFVSAVRLFNRFDVPSGESEYIWDTDFRDFLRKYFSDTQTYLIEAAFERDVVAGPGTWDSPERIKFESTPTVKAAIAFGKAYAVDRNRLLAILRNIVKHRGTFVPGGAQ